MPYIGVTEASSTITVEFDSGDSVAVTISTENAVLSENTPIRVTIKEDYFNWIFYDTYLLRYQHDTGASTTGAAFTGNTYCTDTNKAQVGSTVMYLYPATSTVNTNKTTYAAELAAVSTDLTTTGTPVTGLTDPVTIDSTSGFAADGAFHVTSDSNNAGKLTWDRARSLPAVVIHDWPAMTGDPANPTIYPNYDNVLPYGSFIDGSIIHSGEYTRAHSDITFFLKGNDNTATVPEVGTSVTIKSSMGTDLGGAPDGGNALDFSAISNTVDKPLTFPITTPNYYQGELSFWVMPNYTGIPSTTQYFMHNTDIYLYHNTNGTLYMQIASNGGTIYFPTTDVWSPVSGQQYFMEISYSQITCNLKVNSQILTEKDAAAYITELSFGRQYKAGSSMDFSISDITLTSSPNTPAVPTVSGKPILLPHFKHN